MGHKVAWSAHCELSYFGDRFITLDHSDICSSSGWWSGGEAEATRPSQPAPLPLAVEIVRRAGWEAWAGAGDV